MADPNKRNVHYKWIIGILITLLILVTAIFVGVIWTKYIYKAETIAVFASVVATTLSIMLSILAIVYSYYSIVETSRQVGQVNKAVAAIEEGNRSISAATSSLLQTAINTFGKVSSIEARQQADYKNQQEKINFKVPENS